MTAKKTVRPLKQPATRRPAKPSDPTTFERTTAPMPRLQVAARPAPELEPDAEDGAGEVAELSHKDLILRLVEVLKSL